MIEAERAWVVREFVKGRWQSEIAAELGFSGSPISMAIKGFCDAWSGQSAEFCYGEERRKLALRALRNYFLFGAGAFEQPLPPSQDGEDWRRARMEHAWLLRAEGASYREIGRQLGISGGHVPVLIWGFSRRVRRAMRRTRVSVQ